MVAKGKEEICTPVTFSFASSTHNVSFSGAGETTTIILNIEDWGDVTSDNYDTWGATGNHLSITTSTGALVIRSKTYSSSSSFSIVVALGGNANITGNIICKDVVCGGEATCAINATYVPKYSVSISYNISDTSNVSISGSLAGSTFGLSMSTQNFSKSVSEGSYNLTLNRCQITVTATFAADTMGLFCNDVLVEDIGSISGTSFSISSTFTYSFDITNSSKAFTIKPYNKPTGKINFNYTGGSSAFDIAVYLMSTVNGREEVTSFKLGTLDTNISGRTIYNFENQYYNGFTNVEVMVSGSSASAYNKVSMNISSSANSTGYTNAVTLSSSNSYNYTFDTGLTGYSTSTITITMTASR